VPRRRESTLSSVDERLNVGRMLCVLEEVRRGWGEVGEVGVSTSGDGVLENVLVIGLTTGADGGKGNAEIDKVSERGVVIGVSSIELVSQTSVFGSCSIDFDVLRGSASGDTSAVTALASLCSTDAGNVDDDFRFGGLGSGLLE